MSKPNNEIEQVIQMLMAALHALHEQLQKEEAGCNKDRDAKIKVSHLHAKDYIQLMDFVAWGTEEIEQVKGAFTRIDELKQKIVEEKLAKQYELETQQAIVKMFSQMVQSNNLIKSELRLIANKLDKIAEKLFK